MLMNKTFAVIHGLLSKEWSDVRHIMIHRVRAALATSLRKCSENVRPNYDNEPDCFYNFKLGVNVLEGILNCA